MNIDELTPARLTTFLVNATEEDRRALVPHLDARLKELARQDWWTVPEGVAISLALTAIGCLPSAARVATVLGRRGVRNTWGQIPVRQFLAIAEARSLPWTGDLATRLAGRIPAFDAWNGSWALVAPLLEATGTPAPATEGVVRTWFYAAGESTGSHNQRPLADVFRADPHLDVLLPAVFTIDGMGADLNHSHWDPVNGTWQTIPAFSSAVARLVADGRLDRRAILQATVERLVRGDRPGSLRPFTLLHEAMDPVVEDLAAHAEDYARLLPDSPSPVAGLAQRALRKLDDAGRLELETLLEASHPVLLRTEKALVKTQLSWLDQVARREPDRTAEILGTVTAAFAHPALDVQERALTLIAKHAGRLDAPARAGLAESATSLTGDLPARAASIFGTAAPDSGPEVLPELVPLPPSAAMPPPIASAAELAEEVVALLAQRTAVRWERVLAAVAGLPRDGLSETLAPVLDRHADTFADSRWNDQRVVRLGEALRSIVSPKQPGTAWQRLVTAVKDVHQHRLDRISAPDGVLAQRIAELADRLTGSPAQILLATPTHVNGSLDAGTLLDRLLRTEAEGRPPGPLDLEQALLRLPRKVDDSLVHRAAGLTSPAGRAFAGWLAAGGLPDPVSTRFEQRPAGDPHPIPHGQITQRRLMVNLAPARPTGLDLEPDLLTLVRRPTPTYYAGEATREVELLAAVLPHHREVAAAWALPTLAALADQDERGGAILLPLLADCTGPLGPAMSLALAYVLGARHETDRAAAVDAFLALAPFDPAYATAVGRDLGDLAAGGAVKLNRAASTLADAHQAGASSAVWRVLAAALPVLLPTSPRGLPDLLELTTRVASAVGAKDQIPGLAAAAGRTGSSRAIKEARRLQTTLSAS